MTKTQDSNVLKIRKRYILVTLLMLIVLFALSHTHIDVLGGADEINAKIYVDGRAVGRIGKQAHNEDLYSKASIWPLLGKHELRFVSTEGQVLEQEIAVYAPLRWFNTIYLSFEDEIIEFEEGD